MKAFKVPIGILAVYILLSLTLPDMALSSGKIAASYFKEMALIMPPVFLLMGLSEVWITKDAIRKWLGKGAGAKGTLFALVFGTLPTGPLYIAFPLAASLLRKEASIHNMVVFLGAWAALKIPQLLVETEFLGLEFTALRFVTTLGILLLMGVAMEYFLKNEKNPGWMQEVELPMKQK
ncbi:MAG: hypothetical protein AVO33_02560 [delta proteobacterium ML8_F1]|nr:MAG: hypothetical protein AVO33_02560 [delta proteobacterium ML8_F1]